MPWQLSLWQFSPRALAQANPARAKFAAEKNKIIGIIILIHIIIIIIIIS